MGQARDEAGNIWETDAQGNAVRLVQSAGAPSGGRVVTLAPNPKDVAQQERQAAQDARQAARDAATDADRAADNARADSALAIQQAKAAADAPAILSPEDQSEVAAEAAQKIKLIDSLIERSKNGWFATGFGANTASLIPGTPARDVSQDVQTVSASGALQRIMEMARNNGGKNPLTPLSNADFQALGQSIANLDPSQSDEQFQRNLLVYRDIYERALGAVKPAEQRAEPEVDPLTGLTRADTNTPSDPGPMPPANYPGGNDPSPAPETAASGETRTINHPEVASIVTSLMQAGAGLATINATLKERNASPISFSDYANAKKWMKANPGKAYPVRATEEVPMTMMQRIAGSQLGTAALGSANAWTLGGIDEAVGGINSVLNGTSYETERDIAQGAKIASSNLNPGSYFAGELLGGVAQGYGAGRLAKLLPEAATTAATSLPGVLGLGTAYGAATGALEANDSRGMGALGGGVAGLGGGLLGRYAVAPLVERGMRRFSDAPVVTAAENALPENLPPEVLANLGDADRLGLPYALADADPKLRMLAGTVTRRSVNARELAEQVLEPRARGQAERAYEAIDSRLAPVTDIAERSGQWKQAAQTASAPYYAAGAQRAAPVDPRVAAFLDTPAGRDALRNARTNAANDGRDPLAMGFDLDEQGEVVIRNVPSWETLDYVKRGIDQQLEQFRNPMTGVLNLEGNPAAQSLNNMRRNFVSTLDELNPDYRAARGAYQGEIQNRDALQRGQKAMGPQLKPRDLQRILDGFDERQLGEFQRGAATNMADTVGNAQLSGNPYNRVFGTPNQQEKVATLFPNGAPDFARTYGLERDMSKTMQEVLGGSPTAGRLQADNQLGDMLGSGLEIGADIATGGGASGLGMIVNAGRRLVGDSMKLGIGKRAEQRAEQLAPVLLNTAPGEVLQYLAELGLRRAELGARKRTYGSGGALLGSLLAAPAATGQ
jgi:hypothetical protein